MPIAFSCHSCATQFQVGDEFAGKRTKCLGCAARLTVPAAGEATPLAATPSAPPSDSAPAAETSSSSPDDEAYRVLADGGGETSDGPDSTSARETRGAVWEPAPVSLSSTPRPNPPVPAAKPRGPKSRRENEERRERPRIYVSPTVWGGVGSMALAVVWFFLGLAANRIYLYPPILFVLGFVGVIRGLIGQGED